MNLPEPSSVHRVGIIGVGTIGASWAAYFLARGMDVQAWDPAPGAEPAVRAFVADAWPTLDGLGVIANGASPERLSFHADLAAAIDGVGFVQESAPEKLDLKRALYAEIDAALAQDAVMASSTSGLLMSELQRGFSNAARFVVGHPFNPPHLIPLVEVLGGAGTDAGAVDWTVDFYNAHGKKAIRLNHEAPGHLVNRLQTALWREAMDAVPHRARERRGRRYRHQVRPGAAPRGDGAVRAVPPGGRAGGVFELSRSLRRCAPAVDG